MLASTRSSVMILSGLVFQGHCDHLDVVYIGNHYVQQVTISTNSGTKEHATHRVIEHTLDKRPLPDLV
jgi:hypothetical protein